ncbi:hypothetical protein [Pedobacter jejuensis]|uniref:DUF3630 family protein n=1 Tax=Pedobacter jejuensis TaxID=1268550 RepID=A0A3N0BSY8_9SPHI|nr:hypothetical protein [Pedobacter jejuensis]RNL52148.1 hypothetical protein D7004_11220 [Pedobacter jejuensis]
MAIYFKNEIPVVTIIHQIEKFLGESGFKSVLDYKEITLYVYDTADKAVLSIRFWLEGVEYKKLYADTAPEIDKLYNDIEHIILEY